VVVQCPSCQSRFRVADEKVTDRGVRVRCSSCKTVFSVKKSGAAADSAGPLDGTVELPPLDAPRTSPQGANTGKVRGNTGKVGGGTAVRTGAAPGTGPIKPPRDAPAIGRASQPPPAAKPKVANGKSRLDADDLFGMDELTGDARAAKSMPSFDDIDLDVPDDPKAAALPALPGEDLSLGNALPPPPPAYEPEEPAGQAFATGPVVMKVESAAVDPFQGMRLDTPQPGALDLREPPKKPRTDKVPAEASPKKPRTDKVPGEAPRKAKTDKVAAEAPKKYQSIFKQPPEPPPSTRRELVSSALTGLTGAALALVVVIAAALSDEGSTGWLGYTAGSDVVATRVVSGLYDTASGRPVFFVRGRVENRSKKAHGPVRVVAELVAEGGTEGKAEALAGAEPSPEDVYALRGVADAEKLNRILQTADAERRLAPGASLPFFAVIADPPADLHRHRLHVRLEPIDAWSPHRSAQATK